MMVAAVLPVPLSEDAVLALLLPLWQLIIGVAVLVVLVASIRRLAQRGRSRMSTALLVTGGAVVGLTVIGVLLEGH